MEKYPSYPRFLNKMISLTDECSDKKKVVLPKPARVFTKKKIREIKRSQSEMNETKGLNWKKWHIKEDKYRVSCHFNRLKNCIEGKTFSEPFKSS